MLVGSEEGFGTIPGVYSIPSIPAALIDNPTDEVVIHVSKTGIWILTIIFVVQTLTFIVFTVVGVTMYHNFKKRHVMIPRYVHFLIIVHFIDYLVTVGLYAHNFFV
jgi:hypothetical protein